MFLLGIAALCTIVSVIGFTYRMQQIEKAQTESEALIKQLAEITKQLSLMIKDKNERS